ncbi:uncharacterized protein BO97DRAFT_249942 [Aspergillus homomorphus CBS 101889]|uniref:Uncharacterized protein n=1 Tax=Aspergillus homomorphus (strain CBS 101889) TaxID=1450537 RepID=A0A395HIR7_ASPHC|nr:hypothetical protein BO97DRAFT_249942 [Aspergillus homomorphus CBS 101889]RAL07526.1 hypothetical protein BO97DRAFT_249942 [Aspergillus homomorphus CBS 101889]
MSLSFILGLERHFIFTSYFTVDGLCFFHFSLSSIHFCSGFVLYNNSLLKGSGGYFCLCTGL